MAPWWAILVLVVLAFFAAYWVANQSFMAARGYAERAVKRATEPPEETEVMKFEGFGDGPPFFVTFFGTLLANLVVLTISVILC